MIQISTSGVEAAVLRFATEALPGSYENLVEALARLLETTDADAILIERVDEIDGRPVLRAVAQVWREQRLGTEMAWPVFYLDEAPLQAAALARGESWLVVDSRLLDGTDGDTYRLLDPPIVAEAAFPIRGEADLLGMVSFVTCKDAKSWSEAELTALGTVAEVVGILWTRNTLEESLSAQVEESRQSLLMNQALLECSQALLSDAGPVAIDHALVTLLAATGAAAVCVDINVDHAELGLCMSVEHRAISPRLSEDRFREVLSVVPWSRLPAMRDRLARGETVVIESAADIAADDLAYFKAMSVVRAEIVTPIFVDEDWTASVVMVDILPRRWTDDHRRLVNAVATMFGAYWTRQRHEGRLLQLLESRDQFISSVSHELRTPLAAVVGFAAEVRDGYAEFDDNTRLDLIRLIARQASDVSFIVDDLLVAARSQQARLTIQPSVVDLVAEAAASLAALPPDYQGATIEVSARVEAWADPRRVRQIVRNLVLNANKYGGHRCVIRIIASEGSAMLEVRDNGPGVPMPTRESLFEPYWSGATGPMSSLPSMGLGLSVSRDLARRLGGDLTYRFDGWSVFSLQLPLPPSVDIIE